MQAAGQSGVPASHPSSGHSIGWKITFALAILFWLSTVPVYAGVVIQSDTNSGQSSGVDVWLPVYLAAVLVSR